ncbi:hypothetical protein [Blastococcus sp. SYSU D00820]
MADDFERELQARLAVIEDPDYVDPARADLPARDLVLLVVLGALLIVAMIWWSYPA